MSAVGTCLSWARSKNSLRSGYRLGIVTAMAGAAWTLASVALAADDDWPQFLGPQRNGVSQQTDLLTQWPPEGPRVVWDSLAAPGMSGLSAMDGRLFTMGEADGRQCVLALDADSGKVWWKTPLAPAYKNAMGNGPRATPAIHQGLAYAYTGEGVLGAVSTTDGSLKWKVDVVKSLGGKPAEYGMASSPLIINGLVVVMVGSPGPSVAAFHALTGKLVWRAGNDAAGYASPRLIDVDGKQQIVAFTGASALGLDPANGQQLWQYPYVTDFGCNTATPVYGAAGLLLSAGENHGSVLLRLLPLPGGGYSVKEQWASPGAASVLRSEWQTPVLLDGKLYGFDNVGSAGPISHLTCVDLATGQRRWRETRFGKGNLIAADGKLWITTVKGELVVAQANHEAYVELGRREYLGFTRQAPILVGTHLLLKDDSGRVLCLEVSKQ